MRDLLIGLLPILGVVVGAFLQHILARSKERDSYLAQLRQISYADFLKGVANAAHRPTAEVSAQIADARARMAIYGSNAVLERLAAFDELGATLTRDTSKRAFLLMTEQMRAESNFGFSAPQDGVLRTILFGGRRAS
jgi:hypothetical protein